ncbi:unnamed protein product [Auanema sp. JU1783]|nr:unnamed protein product [Auanema sp. JU1783]
MDDCSLASVRISSSWKKVNELATSSTSTDPIKRTDVACDPMEKKSVEVQTDPLSSAVPVDHITIDEKVLQNLEKLLQENIRTVSVFDELNAFMKLDSIRLETLRTYDQKMLADEEHGVIHISCGSAGRTALLLGEQFHTSWCGHQAKVIISQRNKITSFPQAVCSTYSAWSTQGILAVGNISGEILMYSTEKLITVNSKQSHAITSLNWYSASRLISCNNDGQVAIWVLKGSELELEQSVNLSVVNLPRKIRKASASNKSLAIAAMDRNKNELYVASETGGLWLISLPELQIKSIPSEPRGIQLLCYASQLLAIVDDFSNVTLISADGEYFKAAS